MGACWVSSNGNTKEVPKSDNKNKKKDLKQPMTNPDEKIEENTQSNK